MWQLKAREFYWLMHSGLRHVPAKEYQSMSRHASYMARLYLMQAIGSPIDEPE
jgi:hypothetical protein